LAGCYTSYIDMIFFHQHISDEELAKLFRASLADRDKAMEYIYNRKDIRKKVRDVALNFSGNQQDAEDLWHDVFIVAVKKIAEGDFRSASVADVRERPALSAFMVGIAKGIWINRLRKKTPVPGLEPYINLPADGALEKWILRQEGVQILHALIDDMTEKCRRLLGLYNQYFSLKEVRDLLNLPSEKYANKNIDLCRKKLRRHLENHPDLLDALDPYL